MNVLIIEDYFIKAEDLRYALEMIDIHDDSITEVMCRDHAIEALTKDTFDFILLDMFFPQEPDGYEYPMCGLQILDWLDKHKRSEKVIVTSSVKCDMSKYDRVVGQIHYGVDDVEYKMEELVIICGLD